MTEEDFPELFLFVKLSSQILYLTKSKPTWAKLGKEEALNTLSSRPKDERLNVICRIGEYDISHVCAPGRKYFVVFKKTREALFGFPDDSQYFTVSNGHFVYLNQYYFGDEMGFDKKISDDNYSIFMDYLLKNHSDVVFDLDILVPRTRTRD